MTIHIKDAGVWKQVTQPSIRDAGVWKSVQSQHVKDAGVWKQAFSATTYLYDYGVGASNWSFYGTVNESSFQSTYMHLYDA